MTQLRDVNGSVHIVPNVQWTVGRELRRRIKNRFDEEGIEIPFPHRTLYVGAGEQGRLEVPGGASTTR